MTVCATLRSSSSVPSGIVLAYMEIVGIGLTYREPRHLSVGANHSGSRQQERVALLVTKTLQDRYLCYKAAAEAGARPVRRHWSDENQMRA